MQPHSLLTPDVNSAPHPVVVADPNSPAALGQPLASEVTGQAEPPTQTNAVRRFTDVQYRPLQPHLAAVREGIDALDVQIVQLLAQRAALVKDATRFKLNAHQAAAPARQAQVFERVRTLARTHGAVAHDFEGVVETTYRAMVAAFIAREQHHLSDTELI